MAIKKLPPPKPAPCNMLTTDPCETTSPMVIMYKDRKPNTFLSPFVMGLFSVIFLLYPRPCLAPSGITYLLPMNNYFLPGYCFEKTVTTALALNYLLLFHSLFFLSTSGNTWSGSSITLSILLVEAYL